MINVYTEEEAREKVCPQAIHMLGMQPLINCMGGGCMAWRFRPHKNDADTWIHDKGYCGLCNEP